MKKISLFKKIRLAFMSTGWLTKLFIMFYPIWMLYMIFDDDSTFLSIVGMIGYGIVVGAMSCVFISAFTSNLKFYKTLPLTPSDIVDIMSVHILIFNILSVIPQIVFIMFLGQAAALPYFLCVDCVLLGIESLLILWYANDKYAFTAAKDPHDDGNTIRVMWMSFGYMAVMGAVFVAIIFQGIGKNADPQADTGMLLVLSGAGLLLFGAVCGYSRKIKNAFMD